jgi:hypothetical protein
LISLPFPETLLPTPCMGVGGEGFGEFFVRAGAAYEKPLAPFPKDLFPDFSKAD